MSLVRFTSLDEARLALLRRPGGERLAARIRSLWRFASRIVPGPAPRGVARFRSIEEANRAREVWVKRRAQVLRAAGPERSSRGAVRPPAREQ